MLSMETKFSVSLSKIISELELDVAYMPNEPETIHVSSKDITRPGLELTGFLDFFDNSRIILFGNTENSYLNKFSSEQRIYVIERIFALKPPAIIITRGIIPYTELMSAAEKYKIPVLRSSEPTSGLSASLVSLLNNELAPRVTRHGVLVEVAKVKLPLNLLKEVIGSLQMMPLKSEEFPINSSSAPLPKISVILSNCVA